MQLSRFIIAIALVPSALRADVTIRYKNEVNLGVLQNATRGAVFSIPQLSLMRVKGAKASAGMGAFASLIDTGSGQIMLIDSQHKTYATAALKDYADKMASAIPQPAVSAEAKNVLDSMKTTTSVNKTGRTMVIQGIQADEIEFTLSVNMGAPAPSQQPAVTIPAVTMKAVMQFWTARPDEALRHPALRELAGYGAYARLLLNPMDSIQKILSSLPLVSQDAFAKVQELSQNTPLILKSHTEISMPMMMQSAQQSDPHSLPGGLDPNRPLMETNSEVIEISTDPIEDSTFEVPPDLQPVTLADFRKAITANLVTPVASAK